MEAEIPLRCLVIDGEVVNFQQAFTGSTTCISLEGKTMRFLMNVKIAHAQFNARVKEGTAGLKLKQILDEIKPEAVYFTDDGGCRSAVLIVEMGTLQRYPLWPNQALFERGREVRYLRKEFIGGEPAPIDIENACWLCHAAREMETVIR